MGIDRRISLERVLEFRKRMYEESLALVKRKGADYNRDQQESGDTLFNLRVATILGIVPNDPTSILVRLSDKLMRLISLTKDPRRNPEVKDESVLDTVRDVHNYVDYLALFYLEEREIWRRIYEAMNAPRRRVRPAILKGAGVTSRLANREER